MSGESLEISGILRALRRYTRLIALVMFTCMLAAYLAGRYIPRKYKSKAVLNIQTAYFQSPLVGDLFPTSGDPAEQNAQRMSLLRYALNDPFVDALAEEYGVYKTAPDDPGREMEREFFLKKIEFFPTSAAEIQISVVASEAEASYEITKTVLNQMIKTLIDKRRENLYRVKDAVQSHVAGLSAALKDVPAPVSAFAPEALRAELDKTEAILASLKSQYTSAHPDIRRMEDRARTLRAAISRTVDNDKTVKTLVNPASRSATQEVYDDLVKKLNYLNVVTQMEGEGDDVSYLSVIEQPSIPSLPFSPPVRIIYLLGVVGGVVLSIIAVVYRELESGGLVSPAEAASVLGVPLLGELPWLSSSEKPLMLECMGRVAEVKSLPEVINSDYKNGPSEARTESRY